MTTDKDLIAAVAAQLRPLTGRKVGVAVSGGSDSTALLMLAADMAGDLDIALHAISVDHGLRPEAGGELAQVARTCARLGIPHHIEAWTDWDGQGNLQDHARQARYRLITNRALAEGVDAVLLGHTADDQAETVLMRLARGAGVDGLSAMPDEFTRDGVTFLRPLLDVRRDALRGHLKAQGVTWSDDPSNSDPRYARVRMRTALETLAPLGLTVESLADTARHMRAARGALDWQTAQAARQIVDIRAGAVSMDLAQLRTAPPEIARRLVVRSVKWLAQSTYPARSGAIAQALDAIHTGTATTLHGCEVRQYRRRLWIFREWNAVRDIACAPGTLWDARWTVTGPDDADVQVRALGAEGLQQIKDWRAANLPRGAMLSLPAVWRGDTVLAAPVTDAATDWHADLQGGTESYFAALLSRA